MRREDHVTEDFTVGDECWFLDHGYPKEVTVVEIVTYPPIESIGHPATRYVRVKPKHESYALDFKHPVIPAYLFKKPSEYADVVGQLKVEISMARSNLESFEDEFFQDDKASGSES